MFCALVGRVEGVIEIWTSRVQKQSRVFNEELRVLVVRAVIGVGVDDQLRIRHVLLHDERVRRGRVSRREGPYSDRGFASDSLAGEPHRTQSEPSNEEIIGDQQFAIAAGGLASAIF